MRAGIGNGESGIVGAALLPPRVRRHFPLSPNAFRFSIPHSRFPAFQ
ncbi:hypothetical protein [Lysobacter gummosus]